MNASIRFLVDAEFIAYCCKRCGTVKTAGLQEFLVKRLLGRGWFSPIVEVEERLYANQIILHLDDDVVRDQPNRHGVHDSVGWARIYIRVILQGRLTGGRCRASVHPAERSDGVSQHGRRGGRSASQTRSQGAHDYEEVRRSDGDDRPRQRAPPPPARGGGVVSVSLVAIGFSAPPPPSGRSDPDTARRIRAGPAFYLP
jgi:hypothetical protein